MQIQRFLGYTDNIKEPRKTHVENILSKAYRYKGNIYTSVEYLCIKLLEGCSPEKEENYKYIKRDGEWSVPRTLYKYMNNDTYNTFIELNKTEYDFVCYLINKGLNTQESILKYDKADVEKVELKKHQQEESKRLQEENEMK